jgi:hypothetical protein
VYRELFGNSFSDVAQGAPIDFSMVARALAEFPFTLLFTSAPMDEFARGLSSRMSDAQKRGALLFLLSARPELTLAEIDDLVAFLRDGLVDPRAKPENLCHIIPKPVHSGMPLQVFEGCLEVP